MFAFAVVLAFAATRPKHRSIRCITPAPVTTYYAPGPSPVVCAGARTIYYGPAAVATTRYRPLIGGTVTRWRYVNRPAVVYPTTMAYYPAW